VNGRLSGGRVDPFPVVTERPTTDPTAMAREQIILSLTERQANALRALAESEELPPEVYAAEVLVKHLYHAYTPEAERRRPENG
jgi:hypothetical protein